MAHKPVVIVGIGEMAGVFARGLLRCGRPVYPITREMDIATESQTLPAPELVLVAVTENDLDQTLEQIPESWRDRLALLQNELLPQSWQRHNLDKPTVISIWFEKKRGQDVKVPHPFMAPMPNYWPTRWRASPFQLVLSPHPRRCSSSWCAKISTLSPPMWLD